MKQITARQQLEAAIDAANRELQTCYHVDYKVFNDAVASKDEWLDRVANHLIWQVVTEDDDAPVS